jgi:hypothetical protein
MRYEEWKNLVLCRLIGIFALESNTSMTKVICSKVYCTCENGISISIASILMHPRSIASINPISPHFISTIADLVRFHDEFPNFTMLAVHESKFLGATALLPKAYPAKTHRYKTPKPPLIPKLKASLPFPLQVRPCPSSLQQQPPIRHPHPSPPH